jgi:hypothetical protein
MSRRPIAPSQSCVSAPAERSCTTSRRLSVLRAPRDPRNSLHNSQSGGPAAPASSRRSLPGGAPAVANEAIAAAGPPPSRPARSDCPFQARGAAPAGAVSLTHGKHPRSSRERMLATVLVGRTRLTALNADFCPRSGCVRACAQFDCRVRIGCEQWVCQASRVALDAPCGCRHSPRS